MPDAVRRRAARSESRRNRERLLDAAGEVMRSSPQQASMGLIAQTAGLSMATAYRYFPSLTDVLNGYLQRVYVQLRDASHDCPAVGRELYSSIVDEWLRLVEIYGRSMVQLRPRSGLLARLHENDLVVTTSREAWERPLRAVLRQEALPDDLFEYAFFLHNMMFDAREILDLADNGLAPAEIKTRLSSAFVGALKAWHAAGWPDSRRAARLVR
jgi:AcrR family transcriptional regulator